MSVDASGSWLPADRIADACERCLEGIQAGRADARVVEAERIMPARWWRPCRITKDKALSSVHRQQFARYWWLDEELSAKRLLTLARGLAPRRSVFGLSEFQYGNFISPVMGAECVFPFRFTCCSAAPCRS